MDESKTFFPLTEVNEPTTPCFRPLETVFAFLLLLFGYFFWRIFPMSQKPLAAAILIFSIYVFTFLVLLRGKCRFRSVSILLLISAGLSLITSLLWDNRFHTFLCFTYSLAAYAYLVYTTTGNNLAGSWSDLIASDLLRSWFVFPFSSFVRIFSALAPRKGSGFVRSLLKLLLGLSLSVIPTWIALMLLSTDSRFEHLLQRLLNLEFEHPGQHVVYFIFGIPLAMYLFGLYVSSMKGRPNKNAEAAQILQKSERRHVLPLLSAAVALVPLLLVYIIYFISQWDYYVSAFSGQLPSHLSYAEYAREGFFELCEVAFLNFLLLLGLSRYVRRDHEAIRCTLCVTFSLFTLILIATAISKLFLYMAHYGLTPDRVHAAWFMFLLLGLFILVLIKQFYPRFKALPLALALTVTMFLLLALSGSNRRIAQYNVDRYISKQTQKIDVYMLSSLGDDAIPEMLRLDAYWDQMNYPTKDDSRLLLESALKYRAKQTKSLWTRTLSSYTAERLLSEAGYSP